ncbi:hypothetical protein Micbo1qcDRAFT_64411 [Microdochium bolleyi]|uniref:Uncharacterized protein n=1 Tax=Microdochium bolleyi TaxID=196109 RepID=A0A136J2K1_9PEZI|nr:hypothetical protein Micbo1qcDRAFT_64411 [Microdochium bolleyi]
MWFLWCVWASKQRQIRISFLFSLLPRCPGKNTKNTGPRSTVAFREVCCSIVCWGERGYALRIGWCSNDGINGCSLRRIMCSSGTSCIVTRSLQPHRVCTQW